MKLKDAFNNFIDYLKIERGLSENTLAAYTQDFELFYKNLSAEVSSLHEINSEVILSFLGSLKDNNYASASIARILISLKCFFKFCAKEKYILVDPAHYFESPKLEILLPPVLTNHEIDALFAQPDIETEIGARDRAIFEIMYGCGLRVSEVCQLKINDVDDQFVRVFGKGKKERLIPIGKEAIKSVDHYLQNFRDKYKSAENALLLSLKGKPIDRFTVWMRIKLYLKKAGIIKNISPHSLRHSFATHLLDNGADIRIIQELLGHADISSTQRYTRVSQTQMQQAFHKFHNRNE